MTRLASRGAVSIVYRCCFSFPSYCLSLQAHSARVESAPSSDINCWMSGFTPVQKQLKDDWDNREYGQVIAENIQSIANFLSSFELSCRSKLADLSDRVTRLEKKVEFIEGRLGQTSTRVVKSVTSSNAAEARLAVLASYKELQRLAPNFWFDYGMQDMPLGVFRAVLKQQYTDNAHIKDIRLIDRKVGEAHQHFYSIRYAFYNPDHVRNYLLKENIEAKPTDFLSKFFSGQP